MELWPSLDYPAWAETCEALHMWTRVVGKLKLRLCAPQSHWWHVALHVTSRGLTTGPIHYSVKTFEVTLDLVEHELHIVTSDTRREAIRLRPMSVSQFYFEFVGKLGKLGIDAPFDTMPKEVSNPIRFELDTALRAYDTEAVGRFHHLLVQCNRLLGSYQSKFCGKTSPVQFYWGSFDLTVVRFSGNMKQTQNAAGSLNTIEEEVAVGFWPGSERYPKPAFYAYALPPPPGYYEDRIQPSAAKYDAVLGEFVLDYEDARRATNPEQAIEIFIQSAYELAAKLGGWDRARLEKVILEPIP